MRLHFSFIPKFRHIVQLSETADEDERKMLVINIIILRKNRTNTIITFLEMMRKWIQPLLSNESIYKASSIQS
jgi:hypothetical protein